MAWLNLGFVGAGGSVSVVRGDYDYSHHGVEPAGGPIPDEGVYASMDELPLWVQERVATLMVCTTQGGVINGLGRLCLDGVYVYYCCGRK